MKKLQAALLDKVERERGRARERERGREGERERGREGERERGREGERERGREGEREREHGLMLKSNNEMPNKWKQLCIYCVVIMSQSMRMIFYLSLTVVDHPLLYSTCMQTVCIRSNSDFRKPVCK